MTPVTQQHDYGCGVACVATIVDLTYEGALGLFGPDAERKANTEGFYLEEITAALRKANKDAYWVKDQPSNGIERRKVNSIVFVKAGETYPAGHYLTRTRKGWSNSWSNFPNYPRESAYVKEIPGTPEYFIYVSRLPQYRS